MLFDELLIEAKKKNMGNRPFWYCWTMGTDPQYQHQGYGKILIDHTFNLAKQDNLPCYLETASDSARAVHLHKGYKLLSEFMIPDSEVKISTMLRE